jgi:Skp family chaperone for outer membrane proteins
MLKCSATLTILLTLAGGAGIAAAGEPAFAKAAAGEQDKDKPTFKLGVVNLRTCFDKDKFERVKEIDAELQKLADDYARRIQEIEKKMVQLKEQVDGLPPESKLRADKILQLRRLETDLKFEKEYGKAQYLEFYSDKKIEIYNEIRRVVALIAQEQKYDLILRVEAPTLNDQQDPENVTQRINNRVVLYSHESVDITGMVVERLNAEYKKQKAAGGDKKDEKKNDGK